MQEIWQPQTSDAAVTEKIGTTQKIAKEHGKKFVLVTYDLTIAKKTMQIQPSDKPNNKVFTFLGALHSDWHFLRCPIYSEGIWS